MCVWLYCLWVKTGRDHFQPDPAAPPLLSAINTQPLVWHTFCFRVSNKTWRIYGWSFFYDRIGETLSVYRICTYILRFMSSCIFAHGLLFAYPASKYLKMFLFISQNAHWDRNNCSKSIHERAVSLALAFSIMFIWLTRRFPLNNIWSYSCRRPVHPL